MKTIDFESNPMLFGHDDEQNIVGVEIDKQSFAHIYTRTNGQVSERHEEFHPFILLRNQHPMKFFDMPYQIKELKGDLAYQYIAEFANVKDFQVATSALKKEYGSPYSNPECPFDYQSDLVHQYLMQTGKVFFKGMEFQEMKRLSLDIETRTEKGFSFPNAERDGDRIFSIAMVTSDGNCHILSENDMDEKTMLEEMVRLICLEDPDIIEGHNIFKFDFSYIATRAKRHKVSLKLGRDGSKMKMRSSRVNIAERVVDYPRFEIYGRTIVDTWILVQMYDVSGRDLPAYGLKDVAVYFGVASDNREYIEGNEIEAEFDRNPERVLTYNRQDCEEALKVSEILGRSFFQQAKIFPYGYQNVIVRGNATKINSLLIREYLRRGHSIAEQTDGNRTFEGGYTDIFATGIFHDVHHCDVASLYPSIMMTFNVAPSKDQLGVFLEMLHTLRDYRLKAKAQMQQAKEAKDFNLGRELNALQTAFKILINSFYGYLGTIRHNFSDLEAASEVTAKGREILGKMVDWLESNDCRIIELDTDGVYFVANSKLEDADAFIGKLSATLSEGIDVEYDGNFSAMFSYKKKNYALMDREGKMTIKGSGLKSRGMEGYLRNYLNTLIKQLLQSDGTNMPAVLAEEINRIESGKVPVSLLAKREVMVDSVELYQRKIDGKKRNRAAAYELALQAEQDFRPGDQISYYITGNKKTVRAFEAARMLTNFDPANPDYNIPYYCDKLLKLHKKFEEFLPAEDGSNQGELF